MMMLLQCLYINRKLTTSVSVAAAVVMVEVAAAPAAAAVAVAAAQVPARVHQIRQRVHPPSATN
jgi:hypothetical protein